ncbi:hypothetical protein HDU93_001891 [Gonapodya sp. JEL0774]|nr:hypothetical protein HDU93_001891 [Gonapodya sp. JEL0774]
MTGLKPISLASNVSTTAVAPADASPSPSSSSSALSVGTVTAIAVSVALFLVATVLGLVYLLYVRPRTLEKYAASRRQLDRLRDANSTLVSNMTPPAGPRQRELAQRELAHRRSVRASTIRQSMTRSPIAAPSILNGQGLGALSIAVGGDIPPPSAHPSTKGRSASVRSARSARSAKSARSNKSANRKSRASSVPPGSPTLSFAARSIGRRSMDSALPKRHVAIHDYNPRLEDEVALTKGDVVYIREIFNDGWLRGANWTTGREGTFPAACIEPAEESEDEDDEDKDGPFGIGARSSWRAGSEGSDFGSSEGIEMRATGRTPSREGRPRSGVGTVTGAGRRNSKRESLTGLGGPAGSGPGAIRPISKRQSRASQLSDLAGGTGSDVSEGGDSDSVQDVWRGSPVVLGHGVDKRGRKRSPPDLWQPSTTALIPVIAANAGSLSSTVTAGRVGTPLGRRSSRRDLSPSVGPRLSAVVNPHLTTLADRELTVMSPIPVMPQPPAMAVTPSYHPLRTPVERPPSLGASPAALRSGTIERPSSVTSAPMIRPVKVVEGFADVSAPTPSTNAVVAPAADQPTPAFKDRPISAFTDMPIIEPARPPSRLSAVSLGSSVHENPFAEPTGSKFGGSLEEQNQGGSESPVGWHDILQDALEPGEDDGDEGDIKESGDGDGETLMDAPVVSVSLGPVHIGGGSDIKEGLGKPPLMPIEAATLTKARQPSLPGPGAGGVDKRMPSLRSDDLAALNPIGRRESPGTAMGTANWTGAIRSSWASGDYPPSSVGSIAAGRTSKDGRDKSGHTKMRSVATVKEES